MAAQTGTLKRQRNFAMKKLKRWGKQAKALATKHRRASKEIKKLRGVIVGARRRRDQLTDEVRALRKQIDASENGSKESVALQNRLHEAIKRRDEAADRVKHLGHRIQKRTEERERIRKHVKQVATKKRYWRKRVRFFVVKLTKIRKLREARRAKKQPKFESWMANGADWQNSNQATRDFVARGVVLHHLTCTSMNRTFVPPGGSTTSYHLQGMAGDIAGSWEAMNAAQRKEYDKLKGQSSQLELFGPDNIRNLKNGASMSMGEGTALEQLHDSHLHGAQR